MSNSNQPLDLGFFGIRELVTWGWLGSRDRDQYELGNKLLDPYEIMIAKPTCTLCIYHYPVTHEKVIFASTPGGFTRRELAEAIAHYHMELADPNEDPEYMFSVLNGTLDGGRCVHADLTSDPVRVSSDLDY